MRQDKFLNLVEDPDHLEQGTDSQGKREASGQMNISTLKIGQRRGNGENTGEGALRTAINLISSKLGAIHLMGMRPGFISLSTNPDILIPEELTGFG